MDDWHVGSDLMKQELVRLAEEVERCVDLQVARALLRALSEFGHWPKFIVVDSRINVRSGEDTNVVQYQVRVSPASDRFAADIIAKQFGGGRLNTAIYEIADDLDLKDVQKAAGLAKKRGEAAAPEAGP